MSKNLVLHVQKELDENGRCTISIEQDGVAITSKRVVCVRELWFYFESRRGSLLSSEGSYVALLNLKNLLNLEIDFRIPIANEADGYSGLGFDI